MLDTLLCPGSKHRPNCQCPTLQKHYGPRPFRCPFVACRFHRLSFETHALRDKHVHHHSRPFRCEVSSCDYSDLGFASWEQSERHRLQAHPAFPGKDVSEPLNDYSENNIDHLFDLVANDQVDEMRRFLPYLKKNKTLHSDAGEMLLKFIITSGSFAMAELVLDERFMTSTEAVRCAAKAANIALLRWQLANGANYSSTSGEFVSADSEEVFDIWRDELVSSGKRGTAFNWYSIKGARNHAQATRLASFWTEQDTLHSFPKETGPSSLVDRTDQLFHSASSRTYRVWC